MTKLKTTPLKRETWVTDRRRPIVAELMPFYLRMRVKGTREFYDVDWAAVLDLGRKLDARAKLALKKGAA